MLLKNIPLPLKNVSVTKDREDPSCCSRLEETKETRWLNAICDPGKTLLGKLKKKKRNTDSRLGRYIY